MVAVALVLVIMLGFATLAVDVGVLYSARTSAQRAADSAALAGAFTFVTNPLAPQPATANSHALQAALENNILTSPITQAEVSTNVDLANRRVTVDLTHVENTLFGRILGADTAQIQVRGVAETSQTALGTYCVKPWFIPNTIVSDLDPCDACAAGEVLFDGAGQMTPYAQTRLGLEFTIKPQKPQGALAPGQYYCLRLPGSSGANDYRNNIATCFSGVVTCQDLYNVEPGNMVGPTRQGVEQLIGEYPDVYLSPGQYQRVDPSIGDTSQSLIVSPVWDVCNMAGFCPDEELPAGGSNLQIPVAGFAMVFVKGIVGNDVRAHLINAFDCDSGNPASPGNQESGPFSLPLRLVRVTAG